MAPDLRSISLERRVAQTTWAAAHPSSRADRVLPGPGM